MKFLKKPLLLLLVGFAATFTSCDNKSSSGDSAQKDVTPAATPVPAAVDDTAWAKENGLYAVISTTKGKIVCELEYKKAPLTVANFVTLAEGKNEGTKVAKGKPFYDGLTFHRVDPGFVIQGGDPNGNGSGGPGYEFPNEVDPSLGHSKPGTLAMANSGPNTNGSQFYITLAATPNLDGNYNVYGYVVSGMSVVNATAIGDKIESVKIVRVGKDASDFDAPKVFMTQFKIFGASFDDKVKARFPNAIKTASGLYYVIDKPGTGPMAKVGQTVTVHYTGTLWNGTKFDSSVDRGEPFSFPLGQHRVIPGWDEGFGLLRVGTKGKLIIPYNLAYGDRSPGAGIPPKSDLIFEVEMLGVK
jgi:peptidyl-prolyl cis-trans isomerase A (cyclophilin A)